MRPLSAFRPVLRFCVALLALVALCSPVLAEFPIGLGVGLGSVSDTYARPLTDAEYRRQQAENRRYARRNSERATWQRLAARPPQSDEQRADAQLRLARQLIDLGKLDAADRWLARIADTYPATTAAGTARYELGR
jgi:hypothetical protein